ncbi:hypothetical protein [Treponema denticola]|uniref:hypothetical protein n=1 Tax=Treponema denticola TaxID=158 RepID=UPI0020A60892|nr:hypothetical protein [Treponema denticola]UTC93215.1 hypothetical protein E4N84_08940 [Treponema denticola]
MANDGELNFKTKIDDSDLDKGLKRVKSKVNNAAKDMGKGTKATNALKTAFNETGGAASGFASKMGSLASSAGPVAAGLTVAVMAVKKFIEGLKAANEAFKVQEKAEKALQKAAENNPYLQKESVQRLKEFASGLQEISNYGDEGTIDIMAQLASTGRTEAEIMKIMGAAADYAAAKHIDLKTAAETLNSTYSGMAGTMGRQIAEIKDLTDEQLKNGDAIDLIAGKYKGFAKEAADSGAQAKNAFGDFMESIGKIANPMFEALNQKAKDFWVFMGAQVSKFDSFLETQARKWGGIKKSVDEGVKLINATYTNKTTGEEKRGVSFQKDEYLKWLKEELEWREALTAEEKAALFEITEELKQRERAAKWAKKEAEAAQAKANAEAKAAEAAKKADKAAEDSNKKLKESLYALEVEAKAKGQAVSAQDRYNVYLNSYIDLLTKTNGLIKEGYPIEQKRLEQLKEAEKAAKAAADTEKKLADAIKLTQEATEAINSIKREMTPAEHLQKELNALDEIKRKIKEATDEEIKQAQKGEKNILNREELLKGLAEAEKAIINEKVNAIAGKEQSWWDKHASKQADLLKMKQALADSEVLSDKEKYDKMRQLDEAYLQDKAAQTAELLTLVQGYVDQSVSIMNQAANLMLETSKNQATAEQAQLEMKYLKGEMSEEEYNKKLTESKRKAAKEQYKIQMWQWSVSLLQAMTNMAVGISQAVSKGIPLGLIEAPIVAAAGAVQIASLMASKPIPPSFSTGGIVGGSSYSGDNIAANLNSREMVMNMSQQKGLWDFINGGSGGKGAAPNIVINNSASNIATAQPRLTRDKIEIMIDARVNESLKNGRYNDSLNLAQQGMSGDYYGI